MTPGVLRSRPELVVVLAGISAALHVGKLSPALPVLRDALEISLLQAGFLLSMVQLAGMLLGLLLGLGADGIGLRRTMLAGLLLLSAAGAAGGWARDATTLLLLRALEGVGFLLVSLPAPGLVMRLVSPARRHAAMGLWGAYMPSGTALALLFGPWVVYRLGWPSWWWLLAGLSFMAAICLWWLVPPDRMRSRSEAPSAGAGAVPGVAAGPPWQTRLRRTVGSRGPWLAALAFATYSGQWLAVIGFLPSVLAPDPSAGLLASAPLALVAAVNMLGNVAAGRLLQRGVAAHRLIVAGFCGMALGALMAFVVWPGNGGGPLPLGVRYTGVLLFSLVGGMVPATLFALAAVLAPDESCVSTTVGWMQQWSAFGQFVGPPLVGWVASVAGDWRWTWLVTGACALMGVVLAFQIRREMRR